MTATATDPPAESAPPRKGKSRLPLVLGLALAVAGGAGGFLVVRMGLLGGGSDQAEAPAGEAEADLPDLMPAAFVPIPPLTVNLNGAGEGRLLRFAAQAEVPPQYIEEVTALVPRIVDVLNGYLRAVEPADLDDPAALLAIRSQLLRRLQVVAGGDRVRDLLVMEFVVN